VLHWHITNDQSFPLEIPDVPELHEEDAGKEEGEGREEGKE
jgi:N-acetyl-beta-hexosaminidase